MRKNKYNPLFDCGNLFGDIFEGEQLQLDLFVSTINATRDENVNAQSVEQNQTAAETQLYDYSFEYQLLSRLKMDCEYFLNAGNRCEKHLWACGVDAQIAKMRELYDMLPEKPEWLTKEEIDDYADRMAPPSPSATENFRIRDDCLGQGTAKEKFQRNISAIKLLKKLEASGKQATVRDQEILAKYVGWGCLSDAFDATKTNWAKEYRELKDVLTPEEYDAARASTLTSFYTSPIIIKAMYDVLGNLGFTSGNILEPSMGVGNFFGLLPESMRDSRLYGVELDVISGKIAQYLYPKANITIAGFETTNRKDFYDVAIGNVPFGNYRVNDSAYNKLNFSIHNYFFAKALDQARPGGIVAFITSRRTMDKKNSEVRKYIAQRADLLGAIRLPNDAFKENAGTKVVSDIIFLQKRDRIIAAEPDWIGLSETEDNVLINNYFVQRPEMMLGTPSSESSPYGERVFTLAPIADATLADLLQEATRHIQGEYQSVSVLERDDATIKETTPADPNVKNYSYTVVDGAVWYRENSVMVKSDLTGVVEERVKGMIELRDCVRNLIERQLDFSVSDEAIQEMQTELNRLYDNYTSEYGLINSRANALAFDDDSSYFLLCSLEELDENKKLKRKADIFNKRTVRAHQEAASADSPTEALALSIGERGCVSMPYMSRLCGLSEEEIVRELRSVIFLNPAYENDTKEQQYLTADEYLSGNVRKKLEQAELFAKLFPEKYAVNVEALKKVQPKELSATEIDVRLGATWIDKSYIQQFMEETFRTPAYLCNVVRVDFSERTSEWHISNKPSIGYDVNATITFGTDRANAYKILEDTLNLRDVRIYDSKITADGKTKRVLNSKETILAQQKQGLIKDAFREWIWKDPEGADGTQDSPIEGSATVEPTVQPGSSLNASDLNITIPVVQPDGTTENVPVELAPDSLLDTTLTKGDNEITVATDVNGVTIHIVIHIVIESRLSVSGSPVSMVVSKAPDKTIDTGENFDQTGTEITVTYDDGNTKTPTGGYIVTDGANLSNEKNSVNITYTENGKTVSVSQSITTTPDLSKTPVSIAVTPNSYKNTYTEGENFDSTGIEVMVTYGDGHTETKITGFNILGGNVLTPNTQNVTVSYSENGENVTTVITLNVTTKTPQSEPKPSDGLVMTLEEAEDVGFEFVAYKNGLQVSDFTNKKFKSKIIVPEQVGDFKVISLGYGSFTGNSNITEITLPKTVKSFEGYTFANCFSLQRIIGLPVCIPSNDPTNVSPFRWCDNLKYIQLQEGTSSTIRENWFYDLPSLSFVDIPDGITCIGNYAFSACINLSNVDIPDSVTNIGYSAFGGVPHITYHGSASGSPWGAKAIN